MKSSEILARAAELVDSGSSKLVWAFMDAVESEFEAAPAELLFCEYFNLGDLLRASKGRSVMALLLCAAIAADMGY